MLIFLYMYHPPHRTPNISLNWKQRLYYFCCWKTNSMSTGTTVIRGYLGHPVVYRD